MGLRPVTVPARSARNRLRFDFSEVPKLLAVSASINTATFIASDEGATL